jgi:hypothetical protein
MKGEVDGKYQYDLDYSPKDPLIETWVFFVSVCQFTFQFLSLRQIEICIEHIERKMPPRRTPRRGSADVWEILRWYERLPAGLLKERNRPKLLKALRTALESFRAAGVDGPLAVYERDHAK